MPENNTNLFITPAQFAAEVKPLKTAAFAGVSDAAYKDATDRMTALLHAIADAEAGTEGSVAPTSWAQVQDIVRAGLADRFFSIGDQLTCQCGNDTLVWDVIGIDHDTPADPQFAHSMTLQLHDVYKNLQFDAPEAFYYCENALEAGTYHFAIDSTDYQFTLASDVAAGSQLILTFTSDVPTSLSVSATVGGAVSGDPVAVTAGSGGTALNAGGLNHIDRVKRGSNRYKESAIRQWLNSSEAAGSVWSAQNNFDRPPSWAADTDGFLNGMGADFLAVIGNATKVTSRNTVTDGGGFDTTTEKFFLLSRREVYAGVESNVNESQPYPYYANYSDLSAAGMGADTNRIKYLNSTKKYWWLRTPFYGGSINVGVIRYAGEFDYNYAYGSYGIAPACNII